MATRTTAHGEVIVGARILVVDDEAHITQMLERALGNAGYQVEIVLRGKEAIRKIQSSAYDFMLVDLQMPDLPGEEVLREALKLPPHLRPIAIIITGKAGIGELDDFKDLGVKAIVKKPFYLETLFKVIYESARLPG